MSDEIPAPFWKAWTSLVSNYEIRRGNIDRKMMDEERARSWDDFVSITNALDDWAFRGQQNAQWALLSSLSRYLGNFVPDRGNWRQREDRAIRIFRRKAHNYLTDPGMLDDDFRCIALMQHHGAPTRLLDFTKSPYVAAFFAMEHATGDAAVYALNTPALWQDRAVPKEHSGYTFKSIDPRKEGVFQQYFACNENDIVWAGEPMRMDRRLVAQSGTFVMPGVLDKSLEEILSHYQSDEVLLRKFVLPAGVVRDEGMRALYRMNITNATLFPDLDGLAKSLAFELEVIWSGLVEHR